MAESPAAHILVVDDHREIREALEDYLQVNGFRVSTAEDAAAARRLLERHDFDLVILDIMMPGEDGLSLFRSLRESNRVPVIFLTAMAEEVDRIVGLELGADDYLVKPFSPRELLARVRAVLRRWYELPPGRSAELPARLRFDIWILDTASRRLEGPDGEVVLSSGEYALLLAFLRHPGAVLSRDELLGMTRGREAKAYDRSIDIQVSRLRRKLEQDPSDPRLIVTQWGGGYVLTARVERLP